MSIKAISNAPFPVDQAAKRRIAGLRRFATTTTILSVLGHLVLGFEQSYATPLLALAVAYATSIAVETIHATRTQSVPAYRRGWTNLIDFLLPVHIIGLTCAMFIFPGDRLWPIAFATFFSVMSRVALRVPSASGYRHFFNPSNFGILFTLLAFDSVSIFLPYQFHSNVQGPIDFLLPSILFVAGSLVNGKVTGRLPLVGAWLVTFILQAVVRHFAFDASLFGTLAPATGTAAMLYTFFMITDPGTTPETTRPQILFGAGIGLIYGVLMSMHVTYGLFWALLSVCCLRGVAIWVQAIRDQKGQSTPKAGDERHDLRSAS